MDKSLTEKLRSRIIKNTLLGSVAYFIVIAVGLINASLGMSTYGYSPFLIILISIIVLNSVNIIMTKSRKRIGRAFARRMLVLQLATWLVFFALALFFVESLRPILLMSSIMAITFVFLYQKFITSIYTALIIAFIYLLICYIGIYHFNQPGRFGFDVLLICCYIPASIFIAYMADRMARQRNQLKVTKRELQQSIEERQEALQKLAVIALTDDLTQLMNRRAMNRQLARELERKKRYDFHASVLLIDVDHFKQVNDTHGHDCGDYVLKKFSELLTDELREVDYISRWGGEEFLIILSETELTKAEQVADRLLSKISHSPIHYHSESLKVSFSGGLIEIDAKLNIEENLKKVDELLYKAKQNGRNQIACSD